MTRRCVLCWVVAVFFLIVAGVALYRGGPGGIDGLFLVIALAWVLLAIQAHHPVGWRG
ncbi:putative protein OS=Tsukamurella paurometabola (strain ATCC 8368 / DSM / CCUG 35730 /CIP 100753 / JCM 10117 / KCTC 9821 / NBRC 16120 / NCIMB 702349/ NCTC 13040) OX=521096 GN=Tpau_0020 PE=4 SV=1 [Tsukamurella paurometabola]|uniref:Uncharacterized protein n=1 Tax=Tsukamurella paurometabola (strain ATCC 8368 / DSM 20162 / CCUG 35730 / CIP 100753 / JCM 10117 / KCTC 9821 / NBRC 16120 / NCIMB 702349 / NCTC 13040) TaxID=521096 RepID=D5UPC2_TSUPD|nr:hypothetical protein [Tsukamurella paurometabola]ADG76674.1 hypothetical protein Tpau_0020 [Tsukamurella paurometabola DSM 20162]SUP41168.1 Uncharacterised protein [Tsukamurella paurometabola]